MEATTDRWMNKEDVVHIYNGILLTHKNKCIWLRSNEVDESRAYYTEWTDFWTQEGKERVGWFGAVALKHTHYHM